MSLTLSSSANIFFLIFKVNFNDDDDNARMKMENIERHKAKNWYHKFYAVIASVLTSTCCHVNLGDIQKRYFLVFYGLKNNFLQIQ